MRKGTPFGDGGDGFIPSRVAVAARCLGVSPETARDMILNGEQAWARGRVRARMSWVLRWQISHQGKAEGTSGGASQEEPGSALLVCGESSSITVAVGTMANFAAARARVKESVA